MSDITKCTNDKCPLKDGCYRWTAPADPLRQSYQHLEYRHVPEFHGDGFVRHAGCEYFIDNQPIAPSTT